MVKIEIKNLTFSYPEREKNALENVNLKINDGEFVVICGKSGCGKSTLLRHMKTVLTPFGTQSGEILLDELPLEKCDLRVQTSKIGFVSQNPDNQIVTDKVWHELAFGLESLGFEQHIIRLRVAEMASFFGIQTWFDKNISELSGGQKQLLNLASIMAMHPDILVLDEPTSQLDPIAASEFLETLKKINRELGTSIIFTEHRLDEVFPMADRVIVMDSGKIIADSEPTKTAQLLKSCYNDMFVAMPSPVQIYSAVENDLACPLSVRNGRMWLNKLFEDNNNLITVTQKAEKKYDDEIVIKLKDVWFKYEKSMPDTIKDFSLEVKKGQLYCIVGGNGTGKTTALTLICNINRPYRGKVQLYGKDLKKYSPDELFSGMLAMLPQNPQDLFVKKTVELDLLSMLNNSKLTDIEKREEVSNIAELVEIQDLLQSHPYDLSGGEQQRAALAKVLLLKPKILLLDEPTKGIDNFFKIKLAEILKKLTADGVTIVMVSHDIEFCAKYADTCAMFFDGNVVTENSPDKLFSGNSFYTTSANRMSRHIFPNAVTNEDVINLCKLNKTEN